MVRLIYGWSELLRCEEKDIPPNFLKELEHEDIRSFYEDDRHILWIGTSRGIYKVSLADKKIVGHYEFENNLVRCVMKDSQGRLWIGSFGSGLGIGDDELQDIKLFNMENLFLPIPSMQFMKTAGRMYGSGQEKVWCVSLRHPIGNIRFTAVKKA